jgi:RimJ/RimL family protein N-acetyltransferase
MNQQFKNFNISDFNTKQSELFFNLIDANKVRLEDFFAGTIFKTKTLKDTQNYCEIIKNKVNDQSYFIYIISGLETDKHIGLIDVKNIDWNVPKAELGYFIDANYEGKGIISQALKCIVDYLIETYQFKKLLCRVSSKNRGSIHIALKNGFQLEGTIRNDYRTTKGDIVDLNYYGRVF